MGGWIDISRFKLAFFQKVNSWWRLRVFTCRLTSCSRPQLESWVARIYWRQDWPEILRWIWRPKQRIFRFDILQSRRRGSRRPLILWAVPLPTFARMIWHCHARIWNPFLDVRYQFPQTVVLYLYFGYKLLRSKCSMWIAGSNFTSRRRLILLNTVSFHVEDAWSWTLLKSNSCTCN